MEATPSADPWDDALVSISKSLFWKSLAYIPPGGCYQILTEDNINHTIQAKESFAAPECPPPATRAMPRFGSQKAHGI